MGSAGGAANMEAASAQGSLLNKVYEMQCAQQQQKQSTIFTVVGGRMVSSGSPMPLNGQQLMMQMDGITSAMTGMSVQEEAMDSSTSEEEESPFSQASRRRDPVYLASMAAHSLPSSQELERHHLDQLQQQLPLHQPQSCPAVSDHQVPDMETSSLNMNLPIDSDFHCGSGRVLKRPDLLPLGNFF